MLLGVSQSFLKPQNPFYRMSFRTHFQLNYYYSLEPKKEMATYSSILAWEIPSAEESGGQ